ncbi:unnamed protein product [Cyclocybe aegerita]|uniref:Uncharacterized protein n=1 Tax=Cyclocybe aegerita TaxID=1973307 RepID=A0A8S0XPE8_CYCAE|nr:unnamed protein product [Cyclocybe aegerita]
MVLAALPIPEIPAYAISKPAIAAIEPLRLSITTTLPSVRSSSRLVHQSNLAHTPRSTPAGLSSAVISYLVAFFNPDASRSPSLFFNVGQAHDQVAVLVCYNHQSPQVHHVQVPQPRQTGEEPNTPPLASSVN